MSQNREQQPPKRNIDQRIDALSVNLELLTHDVQALTANIAEVTANSKRDAESIRTLARRRAAELAMFCLIRIASTKNTICRSARINIIHAGGVH